MNFNMNSQIFMNSRNDNAKPRSWPLSSRDYKVIQIKDEDRMIKMILRATSDQPTNKLAMRLPPMGLKRRAPAFGHGRFAKKRPFISPRSHGRALHIARDQQSTCGKRKRPALVDEVHCSMSKKPCFTPQCSDTRKAAPRTDDAWFTKLGLFPKDVEILDSGEWLTDDHISAAQKLLRCQFPALAGLQEPVLGEIMQFEPMTSDGVQILLNGGGHWVTVCKTASALRVLDSKNEGLTPKLARQIANLCGDKEQRSLGLRVQLPEMHPQRGSSDCGVFALAYATEVGYGGSPELAVFDQRRMRKHLRGCLESQKMTPFPRMNCTQRTSRDVGNKSGTLNL